MGSPNFGLLGALIALFFTSAFFSASETSYSSINHIRIKSLADGGSKRAALVLSQLNNMDGLLSSILLLGNIVNILSATLATLFFVGWLGPGGVTISTVVMTVMILFMEITPKTISKEAPEQFAMFASPIMRVFIFILTPVNKALSAWKNMLVKLINLNNSRTPTEEELLTYVEVVQQEGGINQQEAAMIREAIEFDELKTSDIFTPRVDIEAVSIHENTEKVAAVFHSSGYSRLPVYEDTIDNIIGIILEKDFNYYVYRKQQTLESILRPTIHIPKSAKIAPLLKTLQKGKFHMAVVVDDYGGTLGIVTVEDILEELVGEIWDEHDEIVVQIQKIDEHHYSVSANTDLPDFMEYFKLKINSSAATVGGWVTEVLHSIPKEGDNFTFEGCSITVTKILRNRVLEVSLEKQQAAPLPQ